MITNTFSIAQRRTSSASFKCARLLMERVTSGFMKMRSCAENGFPDHAFLTGFTWGSYDLHAMGLRHQTGRQNTGRWGVVSLVITPISISDASEFIRQHHRHHSAPQGGLFAVSASLAGEIVAVAIIGRPVARMLQDGWTAEVIRLASTGVRNACSILYGAAWRAAKALGYKRLITYILDTEPGTTLKAAGWKLVGSAGGGSWSRESRPRVDRHPTQGKFLWERTI
jgi:hypothetical protein